MSRSARVGALVALVAVGCGLRADPPAQAAPPVEAAPVVELPAPEPAARRAPPPEGRPPHEPGSLWLYDGGGDDAVDLWGPPDPVLQDEILRLIAEHPVFAAAHAEERLSIALVDLTDPHDVRYALLRPDWEIFTASLSKIAVLLGVVSQARRTERPELLVENREAIDQMIKWSSNEDAMALYRKIGFEEVRDAIDAHRLYDARTGGLWWTLTATRQPSAKEGLNIAGTARQVARYFLLMEQGRLVSPDDSRFIKSVLHNAALAIFSKGIQQANPEVRYYGKPGIYGATVAEGLLIEAPETRYILAVLTEGLNYKDPAIAAFGQGLHRVMVARHAPASEVVPRPE